VFLSLATSFANNQVPLASTSPAAAGVLPTVKQTATQFLARFTDASGKVPAEVVLGEAVATPGSNNALLLKNATAQDINVLNQSTAIFQASFGFGKTGFDRAEGTADVQASIFRVVQRSMVAYLNALPAVTKSLGEFTKAAGEFGQALEAYYINQFLGPIQDLTNQVQDQGQGFSDFLSDETQRTEDGFDGVMQSAESAQQDAIDALQDVNFVLQPNLATQLGRLAQNNATLQAGMLAVFQAGTTAQQQIFVGQQAVLAEAFAETTANFGAETTAFQNVGIPAAVFQGALLSPALDGINNTQDYVSNERDNYSDVFDQLNSDLFDSFGDTQQDRSDLVGAGVPLNAFVVP
jgi:hypothetical protein